MTRRMPPRVPGDYQGALGFEADDEEGASHGVVEKHSLELDVTCDGEDVFEDEDESEQQPKGTYAKYL